MMQRNANKFLFVFAMAAGLIMTGIMLTGDVKAQADEPRAALQVATYDPQTVFQAHPAQEELMSALDDAQVQMQRAQQEGDQQMMQQVQQQYEQVHSRVIARFEDDIAQAMPEVAADVGVQVVALEVVYTDREVQTTDITSELIAVFSEEQEGPQIPFD